MNLDNREIKKEVNKGIGTIGIIRILAELAKEPNDSFTRYSLQKSTGLKRSDLKENLRHHLQIRWVKEYEAIYPKYQINLDNSNVKALYKFFKEIEYI